MKMFYSIWADAINYILRKGDKANWKFNLFFNLSFLLCFNIATIFMLIHLLTGYKVTDVVRELLQVIPSKTAQNFLWAIICLFIPSMSFNYYFVFYRKKYKKILIDYPFRNGRYLKAYFIITVVLFFGIALTNQFLF